MNFSFAYSGREALEYLHNNKHETVLILSDINMPGMSGLDLLKQIKKEAPVPPPLAMMITYYGDRHNRESALRFGVDDFLAKPLYFDKLKEKLREFELK